MERLTEWEHEYHLVTSDKCWLIPHDEKEYEAIQRLGHYEDAEEQGRLVVLPCKVGDIAYFIDWTNFKSVGEIMITHFAIHESNISICSSRYDWPIEFLGKTVFLTRAEAEAHLAKED